jgi:hypothetical protein
MSSPKNPLSGSAAAAATARDKKACEEALAQTKNPGLFCVELSNLFRVRLTEIALLRLKDGLLRFMFPEELKTAGSIPVSSSAAVAAHTAATKKVELFNNFVKVRHASIFESVKLGDDGEPPRYDGMTIQKLMSAPVLDAERRVLGVIQVCRKAHDLRSCGPDFTLDDLAQLEVAANIAAGISFMKERP